MAKLNFVIPMAGLGSRFAEAGYAQPKFMICAGERTLFEYSLLSLPLEIASKVIFIALREHEDKFQVTSFIKEKFNKLTVKMNGKVECEIVLLDKPTGGQAQTALLARDFIDGSDEIAIYNIDTFFKSKTLKYLLTNSQSKLDGVIGAFPLKEKDAKWSFAKTNNFGIVTQTAEKIQISDNALTGLYHFTRASDFFKVASESVENNDKNRGEFYIAPLYNKLIESGKKFTLDMVDVIVPMGTPEEVSEIKPEIINSYL
ncbi:MAG: glycosyltransferase family 2 protein [Elusimicrobia bacterium]|nr:glycosyltransferase family 2 protein [Elusimicrobiota bacterium]